MMMTAAHSGRRAALSCLALEMKWEGKLKWMWGTEMRSDTAAAAAAAAAAATIAVVAAAAVTAALLLTKVTD